MARLAPRAPGVEEDAPIVRGVIRTPRLEERVEQIRAGFGQRERARDAECHGHVHAVDGQLTRGRTDREPLRGPGGEGVGAVRLVEHVRGRSGPLLGAVQRHRPGGPGRRAGFVEGDRQLVRVEGDVHGGGSVPNIDRPVEGGDEPRERRQGVLERAGR